MATHVISHHTPRRKRGGARRPALRRFGALAVTVAALATASWLAPAFYRPDPAPLPIKVADAPEHLPKLPPPVEPMKAAEARIPSANPVVQVEQMRRAHRGVPLDARPANFGEDFEILSAGELDAISQAH